MDKVTSSFCSNSVSVAFVTFLSFQPLSVTATRSKPKPGLGSSFSLYTTRRVAPISTAFGLCRGAGVMPAFLASSVTHRVPTSSALMASTAFCSHCRGLLPILLSRDSQRIV